MVTNSRAKGKRGELEFASLLRAHGFEARRGQQHSGSPESPDVVHDVPGVHFEVKRCQRLSLPEWILQADRDAPPGSVPVIAWRRNLGEWRVDLRASDFLVRMRTAIRT